MTLELYGEYTRKEVHDLFAPEAPFTPGAAAWGLHGIIRVPDRPADFVFFVSYGREVADHQFDEGVTASGVLSWQSQPAQTLETTTIKQFIAHDEQRSNIYLFLRTSTQATQPYTYLGKLKYLRHDEDRERPVYFHWQILDWGPAHRMLDQMKLTLEPTDEPSQPVTDPVHGTRLARLVEPPDRSRQDDGRTATTDQFRARKSPDWSAREKRNIELGLAGERFVVKWERRGLQAAGREDLSAKVRHVAAELGDGLGYDVLSYDLEGEQKFIEVKTTLGPAESDFFVSENELRFSEYADESYWLYRVFDFDLALETGNLYALNGPMPAVLTLSPTQYRASR